MSGLVVVGVHCRLVMCCPPLISTASCWYAVMVRPESAGPSTTVSVR
jgi:hypothetical protein